MDYVKQSHLLIATAIQRLQELIASALEEGAFSDVQRLAGIAEGLRKIEQIGLSNTDPALIPSAVIPSTSKQSKDKAADYPRFETDGPRLVKIGWSKREKATYEHKASRELCEAVFDRFASKFEQTEFRMDEVLPVHLEETEIPSYQAYLVLAWLRSLGLIRKRSKDTYQWNCSVLDEYSFDEAWDSTRERKDS